MAAGEGGPALFQEGGGDLGRQLLFLGLEKAVLFPEGKAAIPVFAGKALFALHHAPAAAGAGSHGFSYRLEKGQVGPLRQLAVVLHQLGGKARNSGHEVGGVQLPALHLL